MVKRNKKVTLLDLRNNPKYIEDFEVAQLSNTIRFSIGDRLQTKDVTDILQNTDIEITVKPLK